MKFVDETNLDRKSRGTWAENELFRMLSLVCSSELACTGTVSSARQKAIVGASPHKR